MLPPAVQPMEPLQHPRPFTDPAYSFQVKWDGVRMLAFASGGTLRLQNRRLRDHTRLYPELAPLPGILGRHEAVLDGEMLAAPPGGKPSFAATLHRDLAGPGADLSALAKQWPAIYAVFDLLWWDTNLMPLPWEERQELLHRVIDQQPWLFIVDTFLDGEALFDAVAEQELEGMVAKRRDSPYIPGRKNRLWLKVKIRREQDCVVGGFITRDNRLASLLMGAYLDSRLVHIGRAGVNSLPLSAHQQLLSFLRRVETPTPPFNPTPRLTKSEGTLSWVRPVLTARVSFAEWTGDLKLRAPVIIDFPGVNPTTCQL